MITPAPSRTPVAPSPVFSERLRDAVDVLEEIKRRGVSEQAAASLMLYLALDRIGEELEIAISDVASELNQMNFRQEGQE